MRQRWRRHALHLGAATRLMSAQGLCFRARLHQSPRHFLLSFSCTCCYRLGQRSLPRSTPARPAWVLSISFLVPAPLPVRHALRICGGPYKETFKQSYMDGSERYVSQAQWKEDLLKKSINFIFCQAIKCATAVQLYSCTAVLESGS